MDSVTTNVWPSFLSESEFVGGLVCFLDPVRLQELCPIGWLNYQSGVIESKPNGILAGGIRPFVVIWRGADRVALTPVFSADKWYRREVVAKTGRSRWVEEPQFYDPRQVWVVSAEAAVVASGRAFNGGSRGSRDAVGRAGLIEMHDEIAALLASSVPPTKEGPDGAQAA